ncbi:ubiquinone-dependent pyruvate dehydrogenase [Kovacikia minuta CCNUW1]|uniref:ubiquinone-dependent pyruvate dehydrogenase n=1 Tax=Kovacikia minuta TaxID=2931930 RepID=UPI001CCF297D|nr:ubiquinone-dependent pyruvate dehydrogenase [Kovacikia minuta]UBF29326.1 ubiquinone-dependent pyruvate dehydrogenase [Kovacikia minuta CCNUW1]
MPKQTIAAKIVETLVQAGVRRVHGVVGDSLNSLVEEIRRTDGIDWIHYRHEEAAAFAAGAEAQLSGQLAVCAGSCGPGNVHLINGLYDCHRSMTPVLAIAAHIPSSEIGTGYFQETHPDRLFVECSHYCELISSARQMPRILQIAMQHAISKSGVSVIALSGDVAMEPIPDDSLANTVMTIRPAIRPTDEDLQTLAALLNHAEKVTLLCGSGCAGAHAELLALGEALKSPMVHALRGKEHVEYDNPYDVGMTGLIGFPSGYRALESCNVLLILGSDFPYKDWYPKQAKIAQIDIRPERLGRRCHIDLGLMGDVKQTLQALLPLLHTKTDRTHLDTSLEYYRKTRAELDSHAIGVAGNRPIYPEYLASVISELAAEDAIFTADVGSPTVWAARYLKMTRDRRLLGSFNHGSMANAMPQAIGAQFLYPDRQVISLSGDGGFTMLMGDFITLFQYDLPVKVIVFNNGVLGFVAMEMKVAGLPPYGTDLKNPDFAKMANAMGVLGIRVEDPADVRPAIERALKYNGPVLVDVLTNPSELSLPPKIELNQAWGFSLYMLKETLSGHGDEVVRTIESNFLKRKK